MASRGFKTYAITLPKRGELHKIPASSAVINAVKNILGELNMFEAAKMAQCIEAAYDVGRKDGAREVFEALDDVRAAIPHQKPGRPKKKHSSSKLGSGSAQKAARGKPARRKSAG